MFNNIKHNIYQSKINMNVEASDLGFCVCLRETGDSI